MKLLVIPVMAVANHFTAVHIQTYTSMAAHAAELCFCLAAWGLCDWMNVN